MISPDIYIVHSYITRTSRGRRRVDASSSAQDQRPESIQGTPSAPFPVPSSKPSTFKNRYDDADDFVGRATPSGYASTPPKTVKLRADAVQSDPPLSHDETSRKAPTLFDSLRQWWMEGAFVLFVLCYGVMYGLGATANTSIATKWGSTIQQFLESHFDKVGGSTVMIQDSPSSYRIVASGRRNCFGLETVLTLRRRQDLLSYLYNIMMSHSVYDTITIDVALDGSMDAISFALVHWKIAGTIKSNEDYGDISKLCDKKRNTDHYFPGTDFVVYSDTFDAMDQLLSSSLRALLQSPASQYLRIIHVTDRNHRIAKYPKALRMEIRLPEDSKIHELKDLYEFFLHYIDHVMTVELSTDARKKASELRERLTRTDPQTLQEAAEKRSEEKRKRERERLKTLPPDERAKEEERLRKRELKKRQKGMRRVVIAT